MAAHRWHMIDTDNAQHLSPAEALAAAEKLARAGTNFMYGIKVAGCVADEIDHEIIEDLFYGLVEHIGRAGERGNARIAGNADAKKVPQTPAALKVEDRIAALEAHLPHLPRMMALVEEIARNVDVLPAEPVKKARPTLEIVPPADRPASKEVK